MKVKKIKCLVIIVVVISLFSTGIAETKTQRHYFVNTTQVKIYGDASATCNVKSGNATSSMTGANASDCHVTIDATIYGKSLTTGSTWTSTRTSSGATLCNVNFPLLGSTEIYTKLVSGHTCGYLANTWSTTLTANNS